MSRVICKPYPNALEDHPGQVATAYKLACERAASESRNAHCTKHVNPMVALLNGTPYITGFEVSDWYEPSTLATYTNGREH